MQCLNNCRSHSGTFLPNPWTEPHVENLMTSEHTDMATSHAGEAITVITKLISTNTWGWFPLMLDLRFVTTYIRTMICTVWYKLVNTILCNSVVASTKCLEKCSAKFLGTKALGSKTISNGQPNNVASYSWQLETKGLNCREKKNLFFCWLNQAVEKLWSDAFVGMQMHPFFWCLVPIA